MKMAIFERCRPLPFAENKIPIDWKQQDQLALRQHPSLVSSIFGSHPRRRISGGEGVSNSSED